MAHLGTFRLRFENDHFIFQISILELAYLQNLIEIQEYLNFRPKMPYLIF